MRHDIKSRILKTVAQLLYSLFDCKKFKCCEFPDFLYIRVYSMFIDGAALITFGTACYHKEKYRTCRVNKLKDKSIFVRQKMF